MYSFACCFFPSRLNLSLTAKTGNKSDFIFEFDTLDELRLFDSTYIYNTRSEIIKHIADKLGVGEDKITNIKAFKDGSNAAAGFTFNADKKYRYYYNTYKMEEIRDVK